MSSQFASSPACYIPSRTSSNLTSGSTNTDSTPAVDDSFATSHSDAASKDHETDTSSSLAPTTARSFGAGWNSSSVVPSSKKLELHCLSPRADGISSTRTRSPSLPVLPSQSATHQSQPRPCFQDLPDYSLYTSTTTSSPNPSNPLWEIGFDGGLRHQPSLSSVDLDFDDHRYSPTRLSSTQKSLLRQSTPNLNSNRSEVTARRSCRSVRFDVSEDDASDGSSGKALSNNMLVLPRVGERRNVFIHRVSRTLTEAELHKIAISFGEIVSVKVQNCVAKPHAFVMFKKPEQAQRFIAHLKCRDIDCEYGKEDYQVQNKALEDPNSANLYMSGLPTDITFDELADLVAPGCICSWKPLMDEAGNRRGPVMVRLQTRPQADDVIRRLSNKYYPGMSELLQVRIADSDEQKYFKRYQMLERLSPNSGLDHLRQRASMPAGDITHDVDDLSILLQKQTLLTTQLKAINEKLARSAQSAPRPFPSPVRFFTTHRDPFASAPINEDMDCPVLSPTSSSYRGRLSSTLSSHTQLLDSIWTSPSVMTTEPLWLNGWPIKSRLDDVVKIEPHSHLPKRLQDHGRLLKTPSAANPHHAKSSPELGVSLNGVLGRRTSNN
ncbi:hypothetical protein I308_100780 [Cryptococcus tetragattii IND107]|uniref:RRM domain-containing protein n=1 Tax=Cryptococcus tetragattii IND107 TaxID=1296105 RepID=A0ABR3C910_9TREE|nr:hypothetical protein I308_00082 [Cryptococcus tetragattii IND107]